MDTAIDPFGIGAVVGRIRYHRLAAGTLVGTFVLMLLGAYTSAIGAGLSCPDWPMCYGTLVPFFHPEIITNSPYSALQIFAEWAHRGLAMIVGLLIVATALCGWTRADRRLVRWSAATAVLLLPLQILLGGLTVTAALQPIIVTAHLATATLILLALTTTTIGSWPQHRQTTSRTD
jgi:cytochrome c oxidase assembly protein subunit 15